MDMYEKSLKMFLDENKVEKENTLVVLKLPIKLTSDGEIDERDFMDRAELLCSLGQTVMISNFQEYYKVVEYFFKLHQSKNGTSYGVNNLVDILMKNTIVI
jgi:archaellum biogenesis ATPase FlaH